MAKQKSLADKLFPIEDSDDEVSIVDIPPEKRRLLTETYDFSIATLTSQLKEKAIIIPDFQREYVWNRAQASRLIESLIIQCPIPVIYLNQEKDERLSVIDGNQRLTSINLFLDDKFPLQGLTAYPELDGSLFSDLDPRFRRHIQHRTLRCITILKETHPQIKFDVFERINTGAVQLNPQEVRHGVFHGPLMKLIDELGNEKTWKRISGHRNDKRMKGSELLLRYFAFLYSQSKYKKPLKSFLNEFSSEFQNIDEDQSLKWKSNFYRTVEVVDYLFGDISFKLIDEDLKPSVRNVNSALFDAVMVGVSKLGVTLEQVESLDKDNFLRNYAELINAEKFKSAITSGTSATASVNYRINTFQEFLKKEL
ncbi:DUF262 domain-containing protein [Alteromonas sp. ASW11-19]|uniref:DUF262 domain-containing protein n=1 Tax=Alteromonas salexigens TaxID=2982530 RepID=A0ABT2VMX3_9ALTE|nr:DUF262 domain-containing protein [Alteromonas salexigens]MCU7554665.1 DUF262 domain-containing protein [Alteromonas salexigens]